ncbi:hypothetical protein ELQ90_12255 [Labedella phragmitis]|uniref:Uncharacterized protein n=1 Tax=Labedella phragmitis TaxID=2498849 RepID=A0A444PQI8_9MICO|nr:hypothetical protein [Labedella phragmitis]RWZ49537.1 hypothetical protein ELQ90_12255 [Labedella phragmitis]
MRIPQSATSQALASSGGTVFASEDLVCATTKYFDPAWTTESVASFPVRLELLERSSTLRLVATWDPRLFALHAPVLGIVGSSIREIEKVNDGEGMLSLDVPPEITEISFQVEALSTYPNDNVGDVVATTFQALDADGTLIDEIIVAPSSTDCAPWSVELAADWICLESTVVPARITLTSMGPGPAPKGLTAVASYADLLPSPVLTLIGDSPPATFAITSADGIRELTLETSRELVTGDQVELIFTEDPSDTKPKSFTGVTPRVQLVPPELMVGLRESGRHTSFPVTASGSQLSTYVPAPTA